MAWTLAIWTLGLWTPGRLDSGRLDAWTLTGNFRIFTTTVEDLNFTEHSQLLQIFMGLHIEKTLFFIDKANRNLKSY